MNKQPPKIGRPLAGKEPRVSLSVSVSLRTSVKLEAMVLNAKQSQSPANNPGKVIDALIDHADKTQFNLPKS